MYCPAGSQLEHAASLAVQCTGLHRRVDHCLPPCIQTISLQRSPGKVVLVCLLVRFSYVSSSPLPFFIHSIPSPLVPPSLSSSSIITQSWFEGEEHKFVQELETKLENLDARDLRQLNELYAEMKRVDGEGLRWSYG